MQTCFSGTTTWAQFDRALVTLPTTKHSSNNNRNLSRNPAKKRCAHALPRARSCPYSKHTLTLSSLMDFCRETWNIIAQWAVYHVCQSKHFQLSKRPRSLTVASCQTLCFISHLTHDSCSSTVSPGTMYRHYFCAGLGKKKKWGVTTLYSTYFAGIFWDSFWRSPANFGSSYIIRK